jgi:hypothetical protein
MEMQGDAESSLWGWKRICKDYLGKLDALKG